MPGALGPETGGLTLPRGRYRAVIEMRRTQRAPPFRSKAGKYIPDVQLFGAFVDGALQSCPFPVEQVSQPPFQSRQTENTLLRGANEIPATGLSSAPSKSTPPLKPAATEHRQNGRQTDTVGVDCSPEGPWSLFTIRKLTNPPSRIAIVNSDKVS